MLTKALQLVEDDPSIGHLRQVVLTGPDIDADVFETEIAPRLSRQAVRRTLYPSSKDKALLLANTLHRGRRAETPRMVR